MHLVEVGEERPFLALLDLEVAAHRLERVDRVQLVVAHQLPGDLRRDRAVDVLVQLDLRAGARSRSRPPGRRGAAAGKTGGLGAHGRTLASAPRRGAAAIATGGGFPRRPELAALGAFRADP